MSNLTPWDGEFPNYDRWLEGAGQKLPGSPYYEEEVAGEPDDDGPYDTVEEFDAEWDLWDVSDGFLYDDNEGVV